MASQPVYEDGKEEGVFVAGIGESQSACFVWREEEENAYMAQRRVIFSMRYHKSKATSGF